MRVKPAKVRLQVAAGVDALDDFLAEIAALGEVQGAGLGAGGGGLLGKLAVADVACRKGRDSLKEAQLGRGVSRRKQEAGAWL